MCYTAVCSRYIVDRHELIFLFNFTEFLSFKHVLHSLEILGLGIIIFFIGHKLFNGKEEMVTNRLEILRGKALQLSICFLKYISKINLNNFIVSKYETVSVKLGEINHNNKAYSSNLVLISLVIFIIIYFLLRFI